MPYSDPPSLPGATRPYPPPPPARRRTDRYIAIGFLGVALATFGHAASVAFVPEPHHWWHVAIAAALAAAGLLPLWAAVGIWRLILAARPRDSDRKDSHDHR